MIRIMGVFFIVFFAVSPVYSEHPDVTFPAIFEVYNRGDYKTAMSMCLIHLVGYTDPDPRISVLIGEIVYFGKGVEKDITEAVWWYRQSAERGVSLAQSRLGSLYAYGEGVEKDYEKSLFWHHKAALQKDAEAMLQIGVRYSYGEGVKKDPVIAHMWFCLSSAHGSKDGREFVKAHASIIKVDQIAEAQKRALEWMEKNNHAP